MFVAASLPPPVSLPEGDRDTYEGGEDQQVIQPVDASIPECRGTDICSICGGGGDCSGCPICNPYLTAVQDVNQCTLQDCEACIAYYNVPTVAMKEDILRLVGATEEKCEKGVAYSNEHLRVSVDADDLKEVLGSVRYSYWKVGETEYRLSQDARLFSVINDGHSYVMAWQDAAGENLAMQLGTIIANTEFQLESQYEGCPLSVGVWADA